MAAKIVVCERHVHKRSPYCCENARVQQYPMPILQHPEGYLASVFHNPVRVAVQCDCGELLSSEPDRMGCPISRYVRPNDSG